MSDRYVPPPGHGGSGRPVRTFLLALVAVALVGAGLLVPREGRVDDPGRFDPEGPEHQLAELDGARTTEAQLTVYARALDDADRACRTSRPALVDAAAQAQRTADAGGARSTTLALLRSVTQQLGSGRGDCGPAFAEAARRAMRCEPRGQRPCGY